MTGILDLKFVYGEYMLLKDKWKKEEVALKSQRKSMGEEYGYTLE